MIVGHYHGRLLHIPDLRRHLYVIGQTGSGKSTLLANLVAQHAFDGSGFALLDPHGDLCEAALTTIPLKRADQLRFVNPTDLDRPVGLNPLSGVPSDRHAAVADDIVSAFKHAFADSWGPRLEYFLTNSVRLCLEIPDSTLLTVIRLLTDDAFRERYAPRASDPVVRGFWLHEYASYDRRFRAEANSPILNKLGRALSSPAVRNVLCQRTSSFDIRTAMDRGQILLVNLSKGVLGEGNASLLGALVVSAITQAALSRADTPANERRAFHLIADEFHSFATASFGVILSEARKYGLTLTLAHQYLGQLPQPAREAVFGNTGNVISFRLGAEDAALMAAHLGMKNPELLQDLPNYRAYGRFQPMPSDAKRIEMLPPPAPLHPRSDKLVKNCRTRFGRRRTDVEQAIATHLGEDSHVRPAA